MTKRSIAVPFERRDRDFAAASEDALLRAQVEEVLAVECSPDGTGGELPWRTSFGTPLHLLRHRSNSHVLTALARVWIRDALARWVPDAVITAVQVATSTSELRVHVRFRGRGRLQEVSVTRPI